MTIRYGDELVTNGTFDTDSGWTQGHMWLNVSGGITDGKAHYEDDSFTIGSGVHDLSRTIEIIEGRSYQVQFEIIARTNGDGENSITPYLGGTAGTARSTEGVFTETIVAGSNGKILFTGNNSTASIDNVSIKENLGETNMARDDSKQILMGGRCGMVDAGSIAFSTTDTTVIVNTPLTFAASAIGTSVAGKLVCSAPAGVITNGAITFTRADGSSSADVLHYIITGY